MSEKGLMTSFFMAGLFDVSSTAIGLRMGFQEVGPLASGVVESGNIHVAFISRMAVTAVMLGLYALTKKHNNRWLT